KLAPYPGCRPYYGCRLGMATDAGGKGIYAIIPGAINFSSPKDIHLRWDGKAWTVLTPKVTPPMRWYPELVADLGRKETLLLGGQWWIEVGLGHRQDTWAWTGSAWRLAHEWISPHGWIAGAHDAARDEFVVVEEGLRSAKTWVFREGRFIRRKPATEAPRIGHMFYHPGLRKVFLYTGASSGTWLWDGKTWTQVPGKTGPTGGALVYDSRRQKVVGYHARRQELWEWDSSGWALRQTGKGPRWTDEWYNLAYDPARGRLVAVGGKITQQPETWEWDGKLWALMKPTNRVPPRAYALFRYVPAVGGCVMFGGRSYIAQREVHAIGTWLWDGKDWTRLQVSPLPKDYARQVPLTPWSSAYDAGRQRLVAFYLPNSPPRPRSLVWEFFFESLRTSQRYPRPGESFQLNAFLPAQANRPFLLALSGGTRPGIPLRAVPFVGVELLPLRPDGLFWSSLGAGLLTVLDRNGRGLIKLAVPNDTRLHWTPFHAAGLTIDPLLGIGAITNEVGLQAIGESIVEENISATEERYGGHNGSLVAIRPATGEILTYVGSRDYDNDLIEGKVDIATSLQSHGSTMKMFTYLTAFEQG
ncbi:MAG: penicillin-binding transpeptidase domain-containing protein, partial [Planctomycetota bacterium]